VRAAAGVARRLGAEARAGEVDALVRDARELVHCAADPETFRGRLCAGHPVDDEPVGRARGRRQGARARDVAFDTWRRVADARGDRSAWVRVFARERLDRLQLLRAIGGICAVMGVVIFVLGGVVGAATGGPDTVISETGDALRPGSATSSTAAPASRSAPPWSSWRGSSSPLR
jgi:hypothetical protein